MVHAAGDDYLYANFNLAEKTVWLGQVGLYELDRIETKEGGEPRDSLTTPS